MERKMNLKLKFLREHKNNFKRNIFKAKILRRTKNIIFKEILKPLFYILL